MIDLERRNENRKHFSNNHPQQYIIGDTVCILTLGMSKLLCETEMVSESFVK